MIKNKLQMKCPDCTHLLNYDEGYWFVCPLCKSCFAESDIRLLKQDNWHEGYNKGFKVGLQCAIQQLRTTADYYEKIIKEY